jgi:Asp-tRNA(Asn)/Glu-tRNA(Gln) amidotransferase A subunit family amidase
MAGAHDLAGLADRICDRIEQDDPPIHAFVSEADRRSRLRAAAAHLSGAGGGAALLGVPVGVKDVIRVDGLPTRAGSRLPPQALDGPQASVVARLTAAGALVAGKTVTAEFASMAPGPTRNPRARDHTPGGSSSGSAAAVAAGMVPLALGTQTMASVIRPAAFCGVGGFRPTYGRVPVDGVIAHSPSLDVVGWFATDTKGLAELAAVLCDGWRQQDPRPSPVLAVPVGPYLGYATAIARDAFASQAAILRAAGLEVREVALLEDFAAVQQALFVVTRYELAAGHDAWFPRYADMYRTQTAAAIREGQAISADEYAAARKFQLGLAARLAGEMDGIDAWITPAAPGPAPAGLDSTGDPVMSVPWSMAGLPAVSLPAGRAGPLPLGLQCIGRPGGDESLLALCAEIEQVLAGG